MPLLFPDTTVLVNFVLMARVDLLAELVGTNGAWTYTIAEESARQSSNPHLVGLDRMHAILGDPIVPSPVERLETMRLRAKIAKPDDHRSQHLGEAETIAVMTSRAIAGAFVTDDLAAADLARSPEIGLKVYTTGDLIRLAVRAKKIDLDTAWEMINVLRSHQRARGMPAVREQLSQWVFADL
ncbi:MAG: hypothetical protein ABJB03_11985 [Rhodoglobus sp.]